MFLVPENNVPRGIDTLTSYMIQFNDLEIFENQAQALVRS